MYSDYFLDYLWLNTFTTLIWMIILYHSDQKYKEKENIPFFVIQQHEVH